MGRLESPTLETAGLFVFVYLLQSIAGVIGLPTGWFALADPLARPWTIVTAVYAHAGVSHLVVNLVALLIVGLPIERFATWGRFHAFFILTGGLSGLTQIGVGAVLGDAGGVIGASGAILALFGYALAGNPLTSGLLARVSPSRRTKFWLLVLSAATVVVLTGGPGVALVAHGSGFALGLLGGRVGVLESR